MTAETQPTQIPAGSDRLWALRSERPPHHLLWFAFWRQVSFGPACWEWTAYCSKGYGSTFRHPALGNTRLAHRVAYAFLVGPIPTSMSMDHLCKNTRCVNPAHLEPVPIAVNLYRTRQPACGRGHSLIGDNCYTWQGKRYCRACRQERQASPAERAKQRAYSKAQRKGPKREEILAKKRLYARAQSVAQGGP